jgi:hypothetical protein
MKLISLSAHNIQKVRDIRFDLEGRNLFLVGGKNKQGKTSAITSLLMALCGKSGMDSYPEVALREGEDEGWVKVSLTGDSENLHEDVGLTLELKLLRKRGGAVVEEFRVLDSAGEEAPEPRTLLKRLYQLKAFDPLAFARMKPADRKSLLEKLLDLDFAAEREQYKQLFEQRTGVNRDAKAAKARFDGIAFYPDVEERSVSDLMEEIDKATTVNSENNEHRTKLSTIRKQREATELSAAGVKEEIDRLQRKLESLNESAGKWKDQEDEQSKIVSGLADQNIAPLRAKIQTIEADNAKARSNAKRKEALDEYNRLENKSASLTEQLETLVNTQKQKIKDAEFPVDGMSVDEKGILLNGLPFEQASQAEQIMASVDVGIALNPTLRLMVCENGNDLDDETIAALDAKLEETDFQMIVELATRSAFDEDLCSVVIKDGKVAKTNPVKTKKPAAGLFEGDEADVDNATAV